MGENVILYWVSIVECILVKFYFHIKNQRYKILPIYFQNHETHENNSMRNQNLAFLTFVGIVYIFPLPILSLDHKNNFLAILCWNYIFKRHSRTCSSTFTRAYPYKLISCQYQYQKQEIRIDEFLTGYIANILIIRHQISHRNVPHKPEREKAKRKNRCKAEVTKPRDYCKEI